MNRLSDAQVRKLIELLVDWRAVGTSISVAARDDGQPRPSDLERLRAVLAYSEGLFTRWELLKILDDHWFNSGDRVQ